MWGSSIKEGWVVKVYLLKRPTVTLGLAGCLRGNFGISEKVNGTFSVYKSKALKKKRKSEKKKLKKKKKTNLSNSTVLEVKSV